MENPARLSVAMAVLTLDGLGRLDEDALPCHCHDLLCSGRLARQLGFCVTVLPETRIDAEQT